MYSRFYKIVGRNSDVRNEECSESDKTELVKKAVEYINANYMKDISLNTLSEYVC